MTQKDKYTPFTNSGRNTSSKHSSNNHDINLLRPSTGETHSESNINSNSFMSLKTKSKGTIEESKTDELEIDQMKSVNEELTAEELFKLHKMLKQAQNDKAPDNSPQSISQISSVVISSIGTSAIKIIYQRLWDSHKLVRKLAASVLIKLCNNNYANQIKI